MEAEAGAPFSPRASVRQPREELHGLRPKGQTSQTGESAGFGFGSGSGEEGSSAMQNLAKAWRWLRACYLRAANSTGVQVLLGVPEDFKGLWHG